MNRRRHRARRIGMRVLKVARGLTALVLLVFVLIQVLLATPWVRGKVAAKLSQRVGGLEVGIADLDWTPWNGATVRGLRIEQPESLDDLVPTPLLEVDEVHAWPDYGAALKGDWSASASEVTVVRPRIHVTAEMLVSIAAASIPEAGPPATVAKVVPELAAVETAKLESWPAVETSGPDTSAGPPATESSAEAPSTGTPAEAPATGPAVPIPAAKPPVESSAPPPPPKVTRKSLRMVVKDGGFELVRAGVEGRLAAIEGINFDLPLFGEAAESSSSLALIECLEQTIGENLDVEVRSEGAKIEFLVADSPGNPAPIFGKVVMGFLAGLPFQADLGIRVSKLESLDLSQELGVGSGEIQVLVRGGGRLQAPASWRGVSRFEVRDVVGRVAGQPLAFESATGTLLLSGGVIQSPDFRLIGDSASILGNGWATSRDGAAVVRVVVPYSYVGTMNGRLRERIPESVFAFRPLKPGNRWFSDVSLWREEKGWSVGFGDGGSVMALDEILSRE